MESRVVRVDGKLMIEINKELLAPVAYMTYHPDRQRYQEFMDAGTRLFSMGVYAGDQGINSYSGIRPFRPGYYIGEQAYDFTAVEEDFNRMSPEHGVYVIPRVYLDCPTWWEQQHPSQLCRDYRGESMRQSFASIEWRENAWQALRAFVDFIEASPWRETVAGYQVAAGGTEEWAYHGRYPKQFADYSEVNRLSYIKWLRTKYDTVNALNCTWKTDFADFNEIHIPDPVQRRFCLGGVLRDPIRERAVTDYYTYHNWLIADTILFFCGKVKEYTNRRLLTGAFYGYVGEIMNQDVGHHGLLPVLQSHDIDYLASPNSYMGGRCAGMDWPYMSAVDSADLHGKLWFIESDTRTCKTRLLRDSLPRSVPDNSLYDGGVWIGPETMEESLSLLKKGIGRFLTGGTGTWWFDMWGGWYQSPEMMKLLTKAQKWITSRKNEPLRSEIAVVIDENGFPHTALDHPALFQLIYEQRKALGYMGAPYHVYLADDLANPAFQTEQYKLVIMLNLVCPNTAIRQGVERLKAQNRTLLWVYYTDRQTTGGGDMTGYRWEYGEASLLRQGNYEGTVFPDQPIPCPDFQSGQELGWKLAQFEETGTPCVCWKKLNGWSSIYSLLPNLPDRLLTEIATLSGVHIYSRSRDVVYAGGQFLSIHAVTEGEKRLYFPFPMQTVVDAETDQVMTLNGLFMDFYMALHETRVFRVEPQEE